MFNVTLMLPACPINCINTSRSSSQMRGLCCLFLPTIKFIFVSCLLYHVLCFDYVNQKPTPPPNLFTFKASSCHAVTLPVRDMQAAVQLIIVTIVIIYFLYYSQLLFCGSVRYCISLIILSPRVKSALNSANRFH